LKTNMIFWHLRVKNSTILNKIMIIKKARLDVSCNEYITFECISGIQNEKLYLNFQNFKMKLISFFINFF